MHRREYLEYAIDEEGLHTPDGLIDPSTIHVARIDRVRVSEHHEESSSTSPVAVVGGAVAGGLIAGPVGALGGALLGSYSKDSDPEVDIPRTVSATMVLEGDSLSRTIDVPIRDTGTAEEFVAAVRKAAGLK